MQDKAYRDFHSRLMPTVEKEKIIGIRVPVLRAYAKRLAGTEKAEKFLLDLPHTYYDENNLHAFLIERLGTYDETSEALDRFLACVDNWATCDMMSPKILAKYPERLLSDAERWMESGKTYAVRFGIKMHMEHFLGERFKAEYMERICAVKSDEYYVKMMVAWYFATALAKQPKAALPYLEKRLLSYEIHNMTVRKALDSRRLTADEKKIIKALK